MEVLVRAKPGDRVIIQAHRVGEAVRDGEILEVQGENGEPPYLVRWFADGHTALFFPGSDATIQHRRRTKPARR